MLKVSTRKCVLSLIPFFALIPNAILKVAALQMLKPWFFSVISASTNFPSNLIKINTFFYDELRHCLKFRRKIESMAAMCMVLFCCLTFAIKYLRKVAMFRIDIDVILVSFNVCRVRFILVFVKVDRVAWNACKTDFFWGA